MPPPPLQEAVVEELRHGHKNLVLELIVLRCGAPSLPHPPIP